MVSTFLLILKGSFVCLTRLNKNLDHHFVSFIIHVLPHAIGVAKEHTELFVVSTFLLIWMGYLHSYVLHSYVDILFHLLFMFCIGNTTFFTILTFRLREKTGVHHHRGINVTHHLQLHQYQSPQHNYQDSLIFSSVMFTHSIYRRPFASCRIYTWGKS